MVPKKHIVIIGAGIAGLTAGHELIKSGYKVTIIEKSNEPGGLASSLQIQGLPVERFYHFICRSDHHLIEFLEELGIIDKLHWTQARTAFFINGQKYNFGTPMDLLFFSPVPPVQRLRFGFHVFRSRYRSQWRWLDQLPAKAWLIEMIGEDAYNVIWHPLLKVKFGEYYDKISAAWVWHRIWRVARSRRYLLDRETFGFLENGSATLIERLVNILKDKPNAQILNGREVQKIHKDANRVTGVKVGGKRFNCDAVISTVPLPILNKILSQDESYLSARIEEIEYIGVVCLLFVLSNRFSKSFWMNINDPRISFNGIIEQSNLNRNYRQAGLNLLYIPFYVPTTDRRFKLSDQLLFAECADMLHLISPSFDNSYIQEVYVFRELYAQAICTTGFADLRPNIRSSIDGLYLTDSTQFYPEDRTISAAIRQGKRAAEMVKDDL